MRRQREQERIKGVCVSGDSLRQFRALCGLTQVELARRAGYSERLVRKAEAGGSLSFEAIADLATALSDCGPRVEPADICCSPEAMARMFVESYDEHEQLMLNYCGHLLADDFVFHCAGDSSSTLAGDWLGAEGFQAWLDELFSLVTRPQRKCLQVIYLTAGSHVTARYSDTLVAADQGCYLMWVNLHFSIEQGLIHRIDNECDTSVTSRLEHNFGGGRFRLGGYPRIRTTRSKVRTS